MMHLLAASSPCRIRFPGFNVRIVCFNPNMQDIEGCSATPIDELFPVNRRRRKASPENAQSITKNSFRREDRRDERSFLNHMPLPMVCIDILIFISHYWSYCIDFAISTTVAYT